jgi:hypothetical protein
VAADEHGGIGVCLSGGGIRSAAFNLGTLRVLQEEGILGQAKWLAAVSGGSYIAGAFTMVAKSIEDQLGTLAGLMAATSDPAEKARLEHEAMEWQAAPAFCSGSDEERLLRNNSRYIAPNLRFDVEIVVRLLLGLLVNVIVIGVALGSVGISLGLVYGWRSDGLVNKTGVAGRGVTSALTAITLSLLAGAVFGRFNR